MVRARARACVANYWRWYVDGSGVVVCVSHVFWGAPHAAVPDAPGVARRYVLV